MTYGRKDKLTERSEAIFGTSGSSLVIAVRASSDSPANVGSAFTAAATNSGMDDMLRAKPPALLVENGDAMIDFLKIWMYWTASRMHLDPIALQGAMLIRAKEGASMMDSLAQNFQ